MSNEVFEKALELVTDREDYICLGGGEPTCHPRFLEYADMVCGYENGHGISPLIVTNGKRPRIVNALLDMVEDGYPLWVELSQDRYHDPISGQVVGRFKHMHQYNKNVGIRTVKSIIPVGRGGMLTEAYNNPSWVGDCACEDYLIDPMGNIWSCGCKTHLLGTVDNPGCLDNYTSDFAHTGGFDPDYPEGRYGY
jgi:hypothetical protein